MPRHTHPQMHTKESEVRVRGHQCGGQGWKNNGGFGGCLCCWKLRRLSLFPLRLSSAVLTANVCRRSSASGNRGASQGLWLTCSRAEVETLLNCDSSSWGEARRCICVYVHVTSAMCRESESQRSITSSCTRVWADVSSLTLSHVGLRAPCRLLTGSLRVH